VDFFWTRGYRRTVGADRLDLDRPQAAVNSPSGRGPASLARTQLPGIPGNLLALQRRAGNRAVASAVRRTIAPAQVLPGLPVLQRVDPPAKSPQTTFFFGGYPLTDKVDDLVKLLGAIAAEKGTGAAGQFFSSLTTLDLSGHAELTKRGVPADLVDRTQTAMKAAYPRFKEENDRFLTQFQTHAEGLVRRMLDESEKRVKEEQRRYITSKWGFIAAENVPQTGPLRKAAAQLAAKRREVDALGYASAKSLAVLGKARGENPFLTDPKLTETFNKDREAWMAGEKQYADLCKPQQLSMPLLGAYTDNDDLKAASRLEGLATMSGSDLVNQIIQQGNTRQRNIIEVRNALGKSLTIWKQDRIRAMTLAELQATPVQHKLVEEKVRAVKEAEEESAKLRDAILVGLGVAALVLTGGAMAGGGAVLAVAAEGAQIAAAGLTIAKVWQDAAAYSLASAAAGTDWDKARAISGDDPSFTWIAHELVLAGIEAVAAVSSFNTIVKTVKELRTAKNLLGSIKTIESAAGPAAAKTLPRVLAQAEEEGVLQLLIEAQGKEFKGHDLAYLEELLEHHFGRDVADAYLGMASSGKIKPLTQEGLEGALGHLPSTHGNSDLAADYILKHKALKGDGIFSPETGIIFIKPAAEAEFISVVVHEMVHAKQAKDGAKFFQFLEEFEAYAAQRAVLRRLRQYGYSPGGWEWLVDAVDYDIALHIKNEYNFPIPPWIDPKRPFTNYQAVFKNALPKLKQF
jgi:hypothetical protein